MKSTSKSAQKYNQANYERVEFTVLKGDKAKIKAYAEEHNITANELIRNSITAYTGLELLKMSDKKKQE